MTGERCVSPKQNKIRWTARYGPWTARTIASHTARRKAAAGDTVGDRCRHSGDGARKGGYDGDQGGGRCTHGVQLDVDEKKKGSKRDER